MKRAVLVLALLCAACQPKPADIAAPESLDAIAQVAADEMNGPPTAIMALLRQAREKPQVGWEALVIGFDGRSYPVNAWLYRGGYLTLAGVQYITRPVFSLSDKAKALIAAPDQPWFEVEPGEPTAIDCKSPVALAAGGCEVDLVLTPTLTAAGKAALGPIKLEPFTVHAVTSVGVEEWAVESFSPEGPTPQDIALTAILGPDEGREATVAQVLKELQSRLGLDAPTDEAPPPPNYIEPDPPVLPVG